MKECRQCHKNLDEICFGFKNKALGYRRTECKQCEKAYHTLYRAKNPDFITAHRRKYKQRNRVLIRKLKNQPCMDCKQSYPFYVMHFDHLDPAGKTANISTMLSAGLQAIQKEAAKCEVVCANCHAERTEHRRKKIKRS